MLEPIGFRVSNACFPVISTVGHISTVLCASLSQKQLQSSPRIQGQYFGGDG